MTGDGATAAWYRSNGFCPGTRWSNCRTATPQAFSSSRGSHSAPGACTSPWKSVRPAPMGMPQPRARRSNGRNPAMSGPSCSTATRAQGRCRPTAIAKSGLRKALASGAELY